MKVGPLFHCLVKSDWAEPILVHTGQHYDVNMSDLFFQDLRLPTPHFHLGIGSGSHAEQTARVMVAYEQLLQYQHPDYVVVVGDVNSTMACAIVAKKQLLPLAHLEAGLRSGDRTMPEEINRLVTDSISDLLLPPSDDAVQNLRNEGVPESKIEMVGNIMIDAYEMLSPQIEAAGIPAAMQLIQPYGVVTLHRPANVDDPERLQKLVALLLGVSASLPLVFPIHPRTLDALKRNDLHARLIGNSRIRIVEPMSYVHFMSLVQDAALVLTDSGGVQEETTYLGIPCLTLRPNTERPITIDQGTNRLVTLETVPVCVEDVLNGHWPRGRRPKFWDGRTAERVASALAQRI